MCFIMRTFGLKNRELWKELRTKVGVGRLPPQEDDDYKLFLRGFDSFTVTAYFNLLFIALENGFRTFYKPVCQSIDIPDNITKVYCGILNDLKLGRYIRLMVLLTDIRNALMHQNGIHKHKDKKIEWSGKTICFKKDKPINYGGEGKVWDVLPSISQGIVEMLKTVVNSRKIIGEPAIMDPSYAHL